MQVSLNFPVFKINARLIELPYTIEFTVVKGSVQTMAIFR